MTVSSTTSRVSYSGNGSTAAFAVSFYFLENTHLKVILRAADGTETVKALTTDYTVSGAGNPAGGTVTMNTAPATGTTLVIVRNVPLTQETDYQANDPFPAESHERALDKLTMEVQQQQLQLDRTLKLKDSTSTAGLSTELPDPQNNKLIGWNESATGLQNIDGGTLATIVAYGTARSDVFTGDGVKTAFTLSYNPGSLNNLDVSIDGATQVNGVDFTWAGGTTLTMTTAVPNRSKLLVRYMQGLPTTTADADDVQYLPATGSATTVQKRLRAHDAKLAQTVSVKDFGAAGDGVTDDTQAIQDAIDSGAKIVNGVEGEKYLITDTLTINVDKFTFDLARCELLLDDATGLKSHILIGDGVTQLGGTVIQNTIFTRAQSATAGYAIDTNYVGNAKFTNCVIYGDSKIYGGIRIYKGIQVEVSNNHILGCVQQSVYLEGSDAGAGRTIDVTIRENRIENGVNGLVTWDFVEGVYCRDNIFFNQSTVCVALNSSIDAKGLSSFKLQENDFDTSITGVYIQNISAIQISDNWFSNISNRCLLVDTNANGGTIADNVIITAVLGIEMRGKAFTINGNYMSGSGTGIAFGSAATIFNVSNNLIQTNYAIDVTANPTYTLISNNTLKNSSGAISGLGGTQTMFEGNLGDLSRGQTLSLAVGASPFTYTSGPRPEEVAIIGGSVSSVYVGGNVVSGTSVANLNISLPPHTSMVVTYSVAPLMTTIYQ